jgi:cell division protein DivIC
MYSNYSNKQVGPKSNKASRRRLRLLFLLVLCYFAWAGVIFSEQMDQLGDKVTKLTVLETKLEEVQMKNAAFHQEVERLNDPEYIEQKLRRDYQMVKESETLFIHTE